MSEGQVQAVVFVPQARADFARRVLGAACQATGVAARLEVFGGSGSLYARVSGRREGPRGDILFGRGPYLAQAVAEQGGLDRFQPPEVADSAPHHPEWRWTALDASAWHVSPPVPRLEDLLDIPRLALPDPARSELGVMAVLATLDRARQVEGDAERGWAWWERRVRSGVALTEDQAGLGDGQASHTLGLGLLDGGGPLPGLAPVPHAVGLLAGARNADAAHALLSWLVSPDAAEVVSGAGGLTWWQPAASGLTTLVQSAPPLDVGWTLQQYRATRDRWLQQGFSPR
jgi:ABC-type Fe3+ transport system substrate-binding protein